MSFILDALKKSESDRQRQSGPSLFEVKVAPPRRSLPVWAVAIAVLLAINVIVISWMLLRHPGARPAATAAATPPVAAPLGHVAAEDTAAARPAAPAAVPGSGAVGSGAAGSGAAGSGSTASGLAANAAARPTGAPPPSAPVTPAPARAASSGQPSAAAPPPGAADQSPGGAASGGDPRDYAPAVEPSAVQGSAAAPESAGGDLPLYQQVVGSANLPDLHLDLHVFAERPQDRFVMINMHRLGEGDSLPNGVQVDAIRPDGVALRYHGIRFLLPRN